MPKQDNLLDLLSALWRRRKYILTISILAALISIVISLLLPNFYQSTTLFYASSEDLSKPLPVGDVQHDIDYYGSDSDLDRIFTIAQSDKLAESLIQEFDLYTHYEIDPDKPKAKTKVREHFSELFTINRTKFDAIQLSIEDEDPQLATDMANRAREIINQESRKIVLGSQKKLLESYDSKINAAEAHIALIADSLGNSKKKFKIYDTESQGQILVESLASIEGKYRNSRARLDGFERLNTSPDSILFLKSLVTGYQNQRSQLQKQLNQFNAGYNQVKNMESEQSDLNEQLNIDKERYNQLKARYHSEYEATMLIEPATVPDIKSRPKRSIYVIAATLLGFIFSSLYVLLKHYYRDINWKEVFHE